MQRFGDIIRNPNFVTLAALIRVAFNSPGWKRQHPAVPFWTLWEAMDASTKPAEERHKIDKQRALEGITDLIMAIANADERLRYTEDHMRWLVEVLDSKDAPTTLAMFKAFCSAPDALYTPTELARVTDIAESTWRWRAAENMVPGCVKKGKQWLFQRGVLLNMGLLTEGQAAQLGAFEEEEED